MQQRFDDTLFLDFSLGEHGARNGKRGTRWRPPGIKGKMCNGFDNFVARHAIFKRTLQVEGQLVLPIVGDQTRNSDETAVTRCEFLALPDVTKQNFIGIFAQRRCDIAKWAFKGCSCVR